ncbi:copper chaperone PCu(A)C [Aliiroseovarius sp. YM-037]|uniref:copper chaperone PCu(A)C n=1 Tax=Aliiroseovarius sp. YM-037 TaxID=3341728 RepID=UPI003A805CFB
MKHRRATVVLAVLLLGGALVFWKLQSATTPLRITEARAVWDADTADSFNVFLKIENLGPPDTLLGAHTSIAKSAETAGLIGATSAPIPSGATPTLAADGAHIALDGVDGGIGPGATFPLTLTFDRAGEVSVLATVADPTGGASVAGQPDLGDICRVGPGEPAPKVDLQVKPAADGEGWSVTVLSDEFTFSPTVDGLGHVPGYGHGHLYINGLKLQRLYRPEALIGALPAGRHTVTVTLNTNDHRVYVVDDVPVSVSAEIVVE